TLEEPAVRDDVEDEAAALDLGDEARHVGVEEGLAAEEADHGTMGRELVEERPVLGESHLAAQPDELADPLALGLAVARFAPAVRAVDAGLAPLAAHPAAEVAEVGHAELDERGHRHGAAVGRGEVPDDRAPAAPHAQRVTGAEGRALQERQQAGHSITPRGRAGPLPSYPGSPSPASRGPRGRRARAAAPRARPA